MTEAEFQAAVIEAAEWQGFYVYHTHDSRRSNPGFPDLVLVHPKRGYVLFAELKSEKGRLTPSQRSWNGALNAAGAEVYVWRPSQMDEIIRLLGRK